MLTKTFLLVSIFFWESGLRPQLKEPTLFDNKYISKFIYSNFTTVIYLFTKIGYKSGKFDNIKLYVGFDKAE